MSLMKSVLPFLTNQTRQFSSGGIACSYFFGNFLLSSLLWYDFKILVKSRGGGKKKKKKLYGPFLWMGFNCLKATATSRRQFILCLALSVNLWQSRGSFFNWKLNVRHFIFLIWMEQFWIWFSKKLTKNKKFPSFSKVFLILPLVWPWNLGSNLLINNSSTGFGWHKKWQPRHCQEGARTHRKVKICKLQS